MTLPHRLFPKSRHSLDLHNPHHPHFSHLKGLCSNHSFFLDRYIGLKSLFSTALPGCPVVRLSVTYSAGMKVFASSCTFDYSWDEVSTANWRKYCPWNDKSTHVVAVDTLSRSVDSKTGIVRRSLSIQYPCLQIHRAVSLTFSPNIAANRASYHL